MDKSKMRERKFAMRIDDLIYFVFPQNDYNHVCIVLFHKTMFFLCLFPPLSVDHFDSPKSFPWRIDFPSFKETKND